MTETPPGVLEFVGRLEDRIADLVAGENHIAAAYSGGFARTFWDRGFPPANRSRQT